MRTHPDVLIVGGFGFSGSPQRAQRYVPSSGNPGEFTPVAHQPAIDRAAHTATVLGNEVLIAGGWSNGFTTASSELYDITGDSFAAGATLNTSRAHHSATLLNDGTVLIAGGDDESGDSLAGIEIYTPAIPAPPAPDGSTGLHTIAVKVG